METVPFKSMDAKMRQKETGTPQTLVKKEPKSANVGSVFRMHSLLASFLSRVNDIYCKYKSIVNHADK
jgi:hypothetical protein